MFSYAAYGLGICSHFSLPDLSEKCTLADVLILRQDLDLLGSKKNFFRATPREVIFFIEDVGIFLIRDGREILVEPIAGVEERLLGHCILGTILPLLLHQRGSLVLHGSAVGINGKAVAFLGGSSEGKSTTAAAMHACGHGIVADDVLCVGSGQTPGTVVFPGFPFLKLRPESAAILFDRPQDLPQVHSLDLRCMCHQKTGFCSMPIPLGCVYVLEKSERLSLDDVPPRQAFLELLRHSYCPVLIRDPQNAPVYFRQYANVANTVPVRRLKRRLSLSSLSAIKALILEDLKRIENSGHSNAVAQL